jgi:WD40 repeat protein
MKSGAELFKGAGHADQIRHLAFSEDGNRIASASDDHTVKVWDITGQSEPLTLHHGPAGFIRHVTFDRAGGRLASANSDGTVRLWDTASGQELLTLRGPVGGFSHVVFSPDGSRLAATSTDGLRVWETKSTSKK